MIKGTAAPKHRGRVQLWLGAEELIEWSEWDYYCLYEGNALIGTELTKREAWEWWKRLNAQGREISIYHSWGSDDPYGGDCDDRKVWPVSNEAAS